MLTWSVTECLLEACVEVDSCSTSWERFPSHLYSSVFKNTAPSVGFTTVQFSSKVPSHLHSAGVNTVLFCSKILLHLWGQILFSTVPSAGVNGSTSQLCQVNSHARGGREKSAMCVNNAPSVNTSYDQQAHHLAIYLLVIYHKIFHKRTRLQNKSPF